MLPPPPRCTSRHDQVILWDKVVESAEQAHLVEHDATVKYALIDEVRVDSGVRHDRVVSLRARTLSAARTRRSTWAMRCMWWCHWREVWASRPAIVLHWCITGPCLSPWVFVPFVPLLDTYTGRRSAEYVGYSHDVLGSHASDGYALHAQRAGGDVQGSWRLQAAVKDKERTRRPRASPP